jgi:hypothetical protein
MTTNVVVAVALGCSGCAQLFGIDTTSGNGIDAPGPGVHATIQRVSIGATTVTTAFDQAQTMDTLTFLDPDGTGGYRKVPGTVISTGSWQADLATGNPVVDFTLFGGRHLWAFPTRDLHVATAQLEHPNAEAPAPAAQLVTSVAVPAVTTGDSFQIMAVGAWAVHDLTGMEAPAMSATTVAISIPYASFAPMAPAPAIKRIVPDDQVLLLRHNGTTLTGVFQTSFDQTDSNMLTGTMANVTQDGTLDANVNPSQLQTRYAAVRPAVSGLAMSWSLNAAPGFTQLVNAGPGLASGSIAVATTKISASYGNPFTSLGWNELLTYATSESRVVTLPTGEMLTLSAAANTYTAPSPNMTLDLPAGLPQTISIDQTPLSSDNMTVSLDPTKYAHVTIVADHPTNTVYQASLYEVLSTSPTTAQIKFVVEALTSDPQAMFLPPDAFQAGHTYTIAAGTFQGGYPNAMLGDLATTTPPFNQAYTFSGVFTVMNP